MSDIQERTKKLLRRSHEVGVPMVLGAPKGSDNRTELLAGFENGLQFESGLILKELAVEMVGRSAMSMTWSSRLVPGASAKSKSGCAAPPARSRP